MPTQMKECSELENMIDEIKQKFDEIKLIQCKEDSVISQTIKDRQRPN